jgi:hypothetical protein
MSRARTAPTLVSVWQDQYLVRLNLWRMLLFVLATYIQAKRLWIKAPAKVLPYVSCGDKEATKVRRPDSDYRS